MLSNCLDIFTIIATYYILPHRHNRLLTMNARIQMAISFDHKAMHTPKSFGFCIYGDVNLPREVRTGEPIHYSLFKFTIMEVGDIHVEGGFFFIPVELEPIQVRTKDEWTDLKESLLNLFGISKYKLGLSPEHLGWNISHQLPKNK